MPSHFPQARQALWIAEATASPSGPVRRTRLTSRRSWAACRMCDVEPSVPIETRWDMASRAGCIQTTMAILPGSAPCDHQKTTQAQPWEAHFMANALNTHTHFGEVA